MSVDRGVLEISTPFGAWIVPPHRAAWIPAGVAHAHRAHGPTEMRTLVFSQAVNPLSLDRPTVLAADPLLREVIAALCEGQGPDGWPAGQAEHAGHAAHALDARQRRHLELVALDRLRRVEELPFSLPAPRDDRLRALAGILAAELTAGRSVTSVAGDCGFRSPSAFIDAFRRAFGTTPGRHRKDARP